ncbi:MAG: polyphosphate kinase 2 family protein [Pseudorhodoplanes sp.]|uniref:polyphosphate kinase 2 family protein n=1 Tax=Pseudorhodoplanes sp. TaxID=1934341 RepID=UPI003D0CE1C9
MDFRKKLLVTPGKPFRLKDIDPSFDGGIRSAQEAAKHLDGYRQKLTDMQRLFYGDRNHALLIVLQGIDGAGKDGTCWHVISAMDPQGVKVQGFKQPTPEEKDHDFLWRVHPHAPGKGEVAVFNRSHYEDVLVERVHKMVPKSVWKARYDFINDWEKLLVEDNNTTILKFFLYISKEEQLARFEQRLDDPARQWKISSSDYEERNFWEDYISAFEDALTRCSKKHAPWYVIPANHKWFRNLAVSQIIADTMEDMKLKLPKPSVDLAEIRRLYHSAAKAEGEKARESKNKRGKASKKD